MYIGNDTDEPVTYTDGGGGGGSDDACNPVTSALGEIPAKDSTRYYLVYDEEVVVGEHVCFYRKNRDGSYTHLGSSTAIDQADSHVVLRSDGNVDIEAH